MLPALHLDLNSSGSECFGRLTGKCESTGIPFKRDPLAKEVWINEMNGYHVPEFSPTKSDISVRYCLSVMS